MNRRDFLCLRLAHGRRVLEVSCQSLYMRLIDARALRPESPVDFDPVFGEPPSLVEMPSVDDLAARLDRELRDVETLKLLESSWLDATEVSSFLTPMVSRFEARGGRVERG
ncbi:MAG: hypothetical protein LBQ09_12065 [Acidobacteriaceae bacterium]|nr:hypothetical protein [Acidobacteriaceae bacterium]